MYRTLRKSMEGVRKVAGKAAYANEADVYEDDWLGKPDFLIDGEIADFMHRNILWIKLRQITRD